MAIQDLLSAIGGNYGSGAIDLLQGPPLVPRAPAAASSLSQLQDGFLGSPELQELQQVGGLQNPLQAEIQRLNLEIMLLEIQKQQQVRDDDQEGAQQTQGRIDEKVAELQALMGGGQGGAGGGGAPATGGGAPASGGGASVGGGAPSGGGVSGGGVSGGGEAGSSAPVGDVSGVDLEGNRKTAFDYFVKNGYTAEQAAGIVANLQAESGVNPARHQDGGPAFGIAQWEGGRQDNLKAFAAQQGKPVSDLGVQLDFLLSELKGPESAANAALKATRTPAEAAAAFENKFERPAANHNAERGAIAEKIFRDHQGANRSARA